MDVTSAFTGFFSQQQRQIKLQFGSAGPAATLLLPQRLVLTEALSEPYTLDVVAFSQEVDLPLKTLLGQAIGVTVTSIEQVTQSITGLVTAARRLGEDGGLTSYGVRVQSALSLLNLRRTSRIFQDLSVPDIVTAILQEHQTNPAIAATLKWSASLRKTYGPRSLCCQYNETDEGFIRRILAEEGINFTFTFDATAETPTHTLVLFDDTLDLPEAEVATLRYRQSDLLATNAPLKGWQGERQLISTSSSLSSYDYKTAQPQAGADLSVIQQGEQGTQAGSGLEDYSAQTLYYASNNSGMDYYARLRQQAQDLKAKTFYGEASDPIAAGTWFELDNHPAHAEDSTEQRQFVVIGQRLEVINNLPADLTGAVSDTLHTLGEHFVTASSTTSALMSTEASAALRNPRLSSHFRAVRRTTALVPEYAATLHRPTATGPQTGIVVGPQGETVYTDELGRVRVQMQWQRPQEHPKGGAAFDERSSTWIRVATPHSGASFGHSFLPRLGEEVVVIFLNNDIDRPLIIAGVHGGNTPVPTFSGVGALPGNRTLSGIQSREHQGGGYGELLMDDTAGQVRTRLASTTQASEVNLGYLTHPRSDGEATARGNGMELRSDGAGAVRSQGLLLTTDAQPQAQGHQLDHAPLTELLTACAQQFKALADYVAKNGGQTLAADPAGQQALIDALASWPSGSATGPAKPLVAISASAGHVSATPKTHLTYAGENVDAIALKHVQLTSGQHFTVQAGQGVQLFAQANGLTAIANQGKMLLQAQADDMVVQAQKNIQMGANGEVFIVGTKIHLLATDGSYHVIGGGHEIGSNSALTVKTSDHTFTGPATQSATPPNFGKDGTQQKFQLHYPGHTEDEPQLAANQKYKITMNDGRVIQGTSDDKGLTDLVSSDVMHIAQLDILKPKL